MKYIVSSFRGAGQFSLGMTPEEMRRAAGVDFHSFKRTPASTHPSDHFPKLGVFADYSADGRVQALEFAEPACPIFQGEPLLGVAFSAARETIAKHDADLEVDADSVLSRSLGISVWAPTAKSQEQAPCESVTVFSKDYYD